MAAAACVCGGEWGIPVDAEGAQAEHRDPDRRLLDERHQLADVDAERPVGGDQLHSEGTKKRH